jgi:hypothetical protein
MRLWSTVALVALLLAVDGSSPVFAQGNCVSARAGRELIQQGQAVPFPEALRRAGIRRNQLAGNPRLCKSGRGFSYRVQVLENGRVKGVAIPAN